MAKKQKLAEPVVPFCDDDSPPVQTGRPSPARPGDEFIRPGDGPFLALLDGLVALMNRDPEAERKIQQEEADRQLEILAVQLNQSRQKELERRAEVRRKRLEREAAEKAVREAPVEKSSVKAKGNADSRSLNAPGRVLGGSPGVRTGSKKPS